MITGERVRLRPLERADLPRFVKWFAEPELRDSLDTFLPISEEQEERWYEANLLRAPGEQTLAIDAQVPAGASAGLRPSIAEPGWVHIGSCGFHEIEWRSRWGEVGIVIGDKSQWGKGLGTDAMRTLVRFGFRDLNLHRIMLRVFSDNPRAIRAYEKAGFKLEGHLREDDFRNGRYRDTLVMAILRSEWESQ